MTVREMTHQLAALVLEHGERILDAKVYSEGCDCSGEAGRLRFDEGNPQWEPNGFVEVTRKVDY